MDKRLVIDGSAGVDAQHVPQGEWLGVLGPLPPVLGKPPGVLVHRMPEALFVPRPGQVGRDVAPHLDRSR